MPLDLKKILAAVISLRMEIEFNHMLKWIPAFTRMADLALIKVYVG